MKIKIKIMLAVLCFQFGISASAYDFEIDGIYYEIVSFDDWTCRIVSGDVVYTGDIVIPNEVTYNGRTLKVTEIGDDAFNGCADLKTLSIEDGTETLSLGSSNGTNALFSDCSLETLYVGRNLSYEKIYSPFYEEESLLTKVTIGPYVTEIGDYMFYGCTGLTEVTIPSSVVEIGEDAFSGCTGLSNITIPNSVKSIDGNAFSGCTGLSNITIPNSVKSIGNNAFSGCTSLTEMIIPNSVNEINEGIFKGCTNLRRLIVEDGAEELQWNCYFNFSDGRPFSGTSLETLYLGRNLVNDNDSPFSFIESLKDVTIGNSVERISNYAFCGCTGLTKITIPNSVTEIGHESFYGCTGLTEITISNSVTEIGYQTFAGCSNLKTIYSLNLQPPTYDIFFDPAFEQTCYSSAVLYVPIGSLNAYQTTIPWSNFGNIQEFDPVTGIDNTKMEVEAENEETTIYDLQGRRLSRSQRGINIINGKKVLVTSHK